MDKLKYKFRLSKLNDIGGLGRRENLLLTIRSEDCVSFVPVTKDSGVSIKTKNGTFGVVISNAKGDDVVIANYPFRHEALKAIAEIAGILSYDASVEASPLFEKGLKGGLLVVLAMFLFFMIGLMKDSSSVAKQAPVPVSQVEQTIVDVSPTPVVLPKPTVPESKPPVEPLENVEVENDVQPEQLMKEATPFTPPPAPPSKIDVTLLPPKEQAWGFGNPDGTKVYLFADPLCGSCQQFEKDLDSVKDEYFFQVYPVTAIGGEQSLYGIANFSCSENPAGSWHDWMVDQKFDKEIKIEGACAEAATSVAEANTATFANLGLTGTPTIVREDGFSLTGGLPPADFKKWVEAENPTALFASDQ